MNPTPALSTRRVPGFGPPDAKIVLIGEAPGQEEDAQGLPFVGSSGKLLNSILSQVGINRHLCYLTNVVKFRPPSNNFEVLYADGHKKKTPSPMLSLAISELHDELRRLRPNVIVPLGGEALRAVTGKDSIDKWRGSIFPSSFGKVIPTYHPAYVMRSYSDLPIFTHDLERVAAESGTPELPDLGHQLEIDPSYSRIVEFLQDLISNPRPIAFDIETTSRKETHEIHVRCLGIADSAKHALCIPFMSYNRPIASPTRIHLGPVAGPTINSHWTLEEEYSILTLLDRIFSSPAILKIAQNFPFDSQVLGRDFGFKISGLHLDTLLAGHTMYPELRKSLDFLASLYTRVPYYSDYDASVDEELWTYNCRDAVVTYEIATVLRQDLRERQPFPESPKWSSEVFQENHIQPAMQVMTRVGTRGVLLDTKVRDELKEKYLAEQKLYAEQIKSIVGSELNPGSTQQVQAFLYDKLKLPKQFNRKTKQPTADEPALLALAAKFPEHKPFFDALLEWRERGKLVSTYCDITLTPSGRLVTSYNVSGTVNGRCNSAATVWGYGTNLQNIPKRSALARPLRRMFRADDGFTLIKADLSQAQWRCVVWLGRMQRLIEQYVNNPRYDVHRYLASQINQVEESEVTEAMRDVAKNGVYGGAFHMMPKTASVTYKVPLAQATFVLNGFWTTFPEIKQWWREVETEINTTRTLVSPLGRVRTFFGRIDDSLYREAYAFKPQAIEGDIIHRAAILCELLLHNAWPVMQIHDELVLACRTNFLGDTLPLVKSLMEYPIYFPGVKDPLIIPSDVSYGPNWLDQEKWKG